MDHLKIYKQLYTQITKVVEAFQDDNYVGGSVVLGILLETLKNIIESLSGESLCPDCKAEEAKKPSDNDMDTLRECVEILGKVKEAMQK